MNDNEDKLVSPKMPEKKLSNLSQTLGKPGDPVLKAAAHRVRVGPAPLAHPRVKGGQLGPGGQPLEHEAARGGVVGGPGRQVHALLVEQLRDCPLRSADQLN